MDKKENLVIMFLLALSIGPFKELLTSFENFLIQNIGQQMEMKEYFKSHTSHINTKNELLRLLLLKNGDLLMLDIKIFRDHHHFIKRFTFKNI